MAGDTDEEQEQQKISVQLEEWLHSDRKKTIGDLVETFGPRSFAILFVVLMALPALPLPTGAVSHVLEVLTMLLALELMVGRTEVWIPKRFQDEELKGLSGPKFSQALLKRIRWIEKFSRPRMAGTLEHRLAGMAFGAAVFAFALTAFLAPPFSGLDTLPALGAVVLGLGVLLGDIVIAGIGLGIGVLGVVVVIGLGKAITKLF
jgi:hypothetical protein